MTNEITTIKLEITQFRDLMKTIDYVTDELKVIANRLSGIEDELSQIKNRIR